MSFLLEKRILSDVKELCKCNDYSSENIEFSIDKSYMTFQLHKNSIYYFNTRVIDLEETSAVSLFSAINFMLFSKKDLESDIYKTAKVEPFRSYLYVLTENYGLQFVPFKLHFIKVTPF